MANKGDTTTRTPEDGTVEWAHYVEQNYSTGRFKPTDLFRAGMIAERERLREEQIKSGNKT